jgi:TPR repeat protein
VKWFRLAAAQEHAEAQYRLGNAYYHAQETKQDFKEAAKWYRLPADQGCEHACYNLGYMYYNGQGVVQDLKEAVMWYQQGAYQQKGSDRK